MVKEKKGRKPDSKKSDQNIFAKAIAWVKNHPYWSAAIGVGIILLFVLIGRSITARRDSIGEFQTAVVERGDLIAIVGATGVVEANQSVDLNWETTGRVAAVNASVNDYVETGDVLAELAANSLSQSVILAQADLVDAQKALDDIANSNTDSAIAYTNLLEAEQELREAEDDRDQWNYNEADMDRIYSARQAFLDAEEVYKDTQVEFAKIKDLDDDDPTRIEDEEKLAEDKLARDKALRELNYILGKNYDQEVAEDFADYDVALAQLNDAQREWERVRGGPNSDDISAAEAKVAAAEATVSLGKIEAPFSGTVTRALPKVGDEVSTGESAFRIDDLSGLYVEVDISEVDINRVLVGQSAELSFDAILGEIFNGEVVEVSSVGADTGNGVDFQVRLKIDDPSEQVRPGMTAAVNIVVSEIKDVISIPNRAVRLMEGKRVVFILQDGKPEELEIQFGASSDTHSEVLNGDIEVGDVIILNPPMELVTNGRPPFAQ